MAVLSAKVMEKNVPASATTQKSLLFTALSWDSENAPKIRRFCGTQMKVRKQFF